MRRTTDSCGRGTSRRKEEDDAAHHAVRLATIGVTRDGRISPIEDFLADDSTWSTAVPESKCGALATPTAGAPIPTVLLHSATDEKHPIPIELTSQEMPHCFRCAFLEAVDGRYQLLFTITPVRAVLEFQGRAGMWRPQSPSSIYRNSTHMPRDGSRLRSMRELLGYHTVGDDGAAIAAVADFEVDSNSWAVRKIVVQIGAGHYCRRATICRCVSKVFPRCGWASR